VGRAMRLSGGRKDTGDGMQKPDYPGKGSGLWGINAIFEHCYFKVNLINNEK